MEDDQKSKAELLQEVETLRRRVAVLEQAEDVTERKKADEEWRAFEERFSSLAERSFDIIFMIDAQGYLTYISAASEKIFHYKPEEMVGTHFKNYLIESEMPRVSQRFAENMQGRNLGILPMEAMRKDGSHVFVELNPSPIIKDGETIGIQGIIRDITERKQAEELLKAEKERAEGFLNIVGVMLSIISAGGNVALINKKGCEILGYEEGELIGKNWFDTLVPQRIRDEVREVFHKLVAGDIEPVEYYENLLLTKDGEERLILFHNTVLRGLNGQMVGALTSGEDITERKKAEEALRESESKYRTLVKNLPQKIFLKDRNLVYISCNDNFARDLKVKSEEIAGKTDYDFFPKELAEKYRADDKKIVASGRIEDIEERYIQKGQEVIVHTIKTPVKDAQGSVIGILGIFWDITERKRIKADLENYKEKVLQAQKHAYISSMGAIVAHQLSQPLTMINMLLAKALELGQAEDNCCLPVLKKVENSLTEAKKAALIIRKFHQYSRDPALETTGKLNVSSTANRIISILSKRAEQAKINISAKALDDLPGVEINETALEQIFLIIIQNAIEAADGRKQHKLDILGKFTDGNIELQFSDDCCGIAPENLDKIFEPFFSIKSNGKGLGLGLEIVQQILIGHGGQIDVESQIGKGTTFYVTLPISNTLEG